MGVRSAAYGVGVGVEVVRVGSEAFHILGRLLEEVTLFGSSRRFRGFEG